MPRGLDIQGADGGGVRLVFVGELDTSAAQEVWDPALAAARAASGRVLIDLSGLERCDGVGLGLLGELDRAASDGAEYVGARPEIGELLRMARLETGEPGRRAEGGFVGSVGDATAALLSTIRGLVSFVGELTAALVVGTATLNRTRAGEILRVATRVGADSVPVVSLLGGLVGVILAMQAVKALEGIGVTSLVPMVVGFATMREFGPLIAGIILSGRSGSSFAAELGTMKVTEELDAYTTLSLDPMVVLVYPRVVAGTLVTPLLTLYSIFLGVLGGFLPMLAAGYTLDAYLAAVVESVALGDLAQAMVKSVAFGFIFSSLGCFHGLRTGSGADAVGASTTRAVVAGIVVILLADSVLSAIFYGLGY